MHVTPHFAGLLLAASICIASAAQQSQTPANAPVQATSCFAPVGCVAPGCIPVPTSLPALSTTTAGDWEVGSRNCGGRRRWCIFVTPCGPPLAGAYCVFNLSTSP